MSETLPGPPRVNIRAIRERFGLTQADIADEIHVDKRTIRRWETGEASPSPMAIAHLRQLRARLGRDREQAQGAGAVASSTPAADTPTNGRDSASLMPRRRLPSL